MNISEKIKLRREELGLSLTDVANELGINKSTMSRYESNEIEKIPISIIEPLAKILKVSPNYLLGWDSSPYTDDTVSDVLKELSQEYNLNQDGTNYIYISSQKLLANQELNKQSIRKAFKQQMNDDIEKELFESGDFQKDDDIIECLSFSELYKFQLFYKLNKNTEEGKKRIALAINEILETGSSNLLFTDSNNNSRLVNIPIKNLKEVVHINIYRNASCGAGTFVDNEVIETITLPKDLFKGSTGTLFGQYAEGDSMVGVGINDGDLIIFEETNLIENGMIGCFCVEPNIATCKRFSKDSKNNIYLLSANPDYPPIHITVENTCFRIVGRYVTRIPKEV